jgi:hypothetical protein
VVDAHSHEELTHALARLLDMSSAERHSMGARGRELALSRHAPDVAAARYHELLRQAVASSRV